MTEPTPAEQVAAHSQNETHRYVMHLALEGASAMLHVARQTEAERAVLPLRVTFRVGHSSPVKRSTVFGIVRGHGLDEHEILEPVVGLDAVDVMDEAPGRDSAMGPLPDLPVLKDARTIRQGQSDVPRRRESSMASRRRLGSSALPIVIAGAPAEGSLLPVERRAA